MMKSSKSITTIISFAWLEIPLKCGLPNNLAILSFRPIDLSPLAAQCRRQAKMAPQSDCSLPSSATPEKLWMDLVVTSHTAFIRCSMGFLWRWNHAAVPKPSLNQHKSWFFCGRLHLPAELPAHCSCGDCNIHEELGRCKRNQGRYHFRVIQGDTNEENQTVKSQHVLLQSQSWWRLHCAHTNINKTKLSFVAALTIGDSDHFLCLGNLMIC